MRRFFQRFRGAVLLVLLAVAVAGVILAVVRQFPYAVPADPAALRAKNAAVFAEKCGACHDSAVPARAAARLPGIGRLVRLDRDLGLRAFDRAEWEEFPALWGKMELVCEGAFAMPPLHERLLRWGTGFSASDRAAQRAETTARRAAWLASFGIESGATGRLVRVPSCLPGYPGRAALGGEVFQSRRVSGDGSLACADCHRLNDGGVDGRPRARGVREQVVAYNTPTVFNAAFSVRQFWDGRAADLARQVPGPMLARDEMDGGSLTGIVARLRDDAALAARFDDVYRGLGGLTVSNMVDALVQYERTLITPNGALDRQLGGRAGALSGAELRGLALFRGLACDACHAGPALGGVSLEYASRDADRRYKTPPLRLVSKTNPYWHDGSVTNLEDAVTRMARDLRGRELSAAERGDLVLFLKAL